MRSEIHWSYFHLAPLQGVPKSLPVIPVDTKGIFGSRVAPVMIGAIQVGAVTFVVPPSSMILSGTVPICFIIILIFSGKWLTAMISERVASSS